jgi:hypothetical protein
LYAARPFGHGPTNKSFTTNVGRLIECRSAFEAKTKQTTADRGSVGELTAFWGLKGHEPQPSNSNHRPKSRSSRAAVGRFSCVRGSLAAASLPWTLAVEMSDSGTNTPPERTMHDANVVAERSRKRRLVPYTIILLIGCLILCFAYRGGLWYERVRISELGGTTVTGPAPIYHKLAYTTRLPEFVRYACASKLGRWIFCQFPVIYAVDLRRVRDKQAVESALQIAKEFDHVTELVLYQSAVTDEHLAILKTGFPKLERLKINETKITDVGIRHLRNLPELQLINAQRTAITNGSVSDLAAIRRLKELNIAETQITSVQPIRDAHPMCYINHRLVTVTQSTDFHRVSRP